MHLDADTIRHLREGRLPPDRARALAEHLSGPCEACEAALAAGGAADGLDGEVDALLGRALPPRGGAGSDLEFARIVRAARPPARRWLPAAALAASVAAAGLFALVGERAPQRPAGAADQAGGWDGTKGAEAAPVPLRLRFLVVLPGAGGPPSLERGVSGQQVPAEASLQFQVELRRPAEVVLLRTSPGGSAEPFFRSRLPAGFTEVTVEGRPAAYPLRALAGPQRFLALASEAPIEAADVARAAALGAAAAERAGPPISVDVVEVLVR